MRYLLYVIYNVVYLIFLLWALIYSHIYINVIFIPNSFQWKDGKLRDDLAIFNISQIVILILESAILLFIIYFIT
jgi:hypothetical protein